MNDKFYVTTAIPYVNAKPHVGHALEFVQADVIKRFHTALGETATLLSGSDENALKNVQAAEKENSSAQEFVDKNAVLFENLAQNLDIKFDIFQKGSNPEHYMSSQKLWELCDAKGDIYKKSYSGLYCLGCEQFYEKDELNENGECFEHPGKKLEEVTEENYFFKLSKYQKEIEEVISNETIKIIPESRKNEVLSFIKQGLKDISISRSNARAKNWGVPVPKDDTQRMYVWFDALNIYQSGVGFGADQPRSEGSSLASDSEDKRGSLNTSNHEFTEKDYEYLWPADVHVIGKGIIRFHAVYWPAFLLSAGLKLPKSLFVHGYFTVDGQKMSKTLGNVVDPNEIIGKYGVDALRYYLLSQIPSTADGDFSEERLKEVYNSDLANGLGNLASRVAKLCEKVGLAGITIPQTISPHAQGHLEKYDFSRALESIWEEIKKSDKVMNEKKPWEKEGKELEDILSALALTITQIAYDLQPFLPNASGKIIKQFTASTITSGEPLFPRLQ